MSSTPPSLSSRDPGASSPARIRLSRSVLAIGMLLLVAVLGLRKIRAPDYWFHLNTGRWIAENGSVPQTDLFTYTAQGNPYLDIHWLFQLGLHGVQSLGGHDAVVVAKALLVLVLAACLATIGWRRERSWVTAIGVGLALVAANDRFLARPELTSFVLLAAVLALLERDARVPSRRMLTGVWAVVPLQLLWVNTHGLFAVGLAVCAIYTVGAAARARRRDADEADVVRFRRLALLALVVLACSFVSPSPLGGALYPLEQLGMIAPGGGEGVPKLAVGETAPLWEARLADFAPALVVGVLAVIGLVADWRHDANRVTHALLFVAFLALFLMANRNGALFALVAGALAVRGANAWLVRRSPGVVFDAVGGAVALVLLLLASRDLLRGTFYERTHGYHEPGLGVIDLFVAEGAADWIERERPPGRIAHSMIVGGYLSWRLWPDYEVMADGRLEIFGARLLPRLALRNPAAFRRLDTEYGFGCVVLQSLFDSPALIAWLQANPEWTLVHADLASLVFARTGSGVPLPAAPIDVHARDFLALPPVSLPIQRKAYAVARQRVVGALRQADATNADR